MPLTAKQESFCLAFLESNVQVRAYEASHDTRRMTGKTIQKRSGELMKHPGVKARIAELRAAAANEAVLDRAWVIKRLMQNALVCLGEQKITVAREWKGSDKRKPTVVEMDITARDPTAANKALELLGRAEGWFVDRHEHTGKGGGPIVTEEVPLTDIERARRIAYILDRGGKSQQQAESA